METAEIQPGYAPTGSRQFAVEPRSKTKWVMTRGVHRDIPAEDYFAAEGVNNSLLKNLNPPARLPVYVDADDNEETWAMRCGTFVHQAILEPEKSFPFIVQVPETYPAPKTHANVKKGIIKEGDPIDWNWSAKICKDWRSEHESKGFLVLTKKEIETLNSCVKAISADPYCQRIFKSGAGEITIFDDVEVEGFGPVLCKCRIDWTPDELSILADIKVVGKGMGGSAEFSKIIGDRSYHVAAAHYLRLWNQTHPDDPREHFVYIVVEREAPYLVAIYVLGNRSLAKGLKVLNDRLRTYAECKSTGVWPGYPSGFQPIEINRFHLEQ